MSGAKLAAKTQTGLGVRVPGTMALSLEFNDYGLQEFRRVAANFGHDSFGYVVTPNVDHIIRYHDDPSFRALYASAKYTLLDSRFLAGLLRVTRGLHLPTCPGSDLTAMLFEQVIAPDDKVIVIGSPDEAAAQLRVMYGLRELHHYNPPMGFIHDPAAVETCLEFVERAGPFRFCLLAVGSPQQEMLARMLHSRGRARGLALCIGASIDFLTGTEKRAPKWIQDAGFEWLYRLTQNPMRLASRYLIRGPRIFFMLPSIKFRLLARSVERFPAELKRVEDVPPV
jgi:exopolysaccharide biosynthesis WecB/TagA/CpsF family protein